MKSYTIHRRTGSRDIIDLWHFLQQGKALADILRVARLASPFVSDEHAEARLCGSVPLNAQDEGFALLPPFLSQERVYTDFARAFATLGTDRAKQLALQAAKGD